MADFLSLGEMLIDFTPAGRTPAGIPLFEQNPGGAPANVAVQAARLGVSAGFIGKVGRDMFGAFLQQTLEQNGVETANLRFSAETATSLAFVQLSERGDRDFSFYRDPGADTQLRFEEVDKTQLDGAKVLCFGSLLLTAEPGRTAVPQIVEYARAHGVITAYDPNWRAPLWPDRETGVRAMRSLLPLADVVKVSDEELEMLTDCAEIPAGAAALFARGVQAVVVTRGAMGCVVCTPSCVRALSTYDTQVVDTTGSGDSFFGAFLTKLIEAVQPVSALSAETLCAAADFANAAGSVCATKKGAIPALPDRAAIEACMRSVPKLEI